MSKDTKPKKSKDYNIDEWDEELNPKYRQSKTLQIALISVIIFFVVAFFVAGNIIKVPYTVNVNSTESVPVQTTKTIYVKECNQVEEQIPLQYQTTANYITSGSKGWIFVEYWYYLNVKIKNVDSNSGGIFKVVYVITKSDGGTLSEEQSVYINNGEEKVLTAGPYKFTISDWNFNVVPPTKNVSKEVCNNVPKQIPSVEYQDKQVTKTKIKYHSLFKEWGI